MAREIVVTSAPRGIKPGRTGFQVVMRTAGMREDVTETLEGMASYRHMPAGGGPNPECFFHRITHTGMGTLHVLGRIVDAGSDYTNRTNKLAHLVAIEDAEIRRLGSSPAAALQAIESRLCRTWPGGPEQREQPFEMQGMPPVVGAICRGWGSVMGDAGWGGVLADRATKKLPTLVIAADSSPTECRRMLGLFAEALALLPPESRWNVTFDTTVIQDGNVFWRGTYAGSPESGQRQPNLLVVDLSRPAVLPPEYQSLPLVVAARTGPMVAATPAPPAALPGGGASPAGAQPFGGYPRPVGGVVPMGAVPSVAAAPVAVPPVTAPPVGPPPNVEPQPESDPGRPKGNRKNKRGRKSDPLPEPVGGTKRQSRALLYGLVVGGVALVSVVVVGMVFFSSTIKQILDKRESRRVIAAWADVEDGQPPARPPKEPLPEDWQRVLGPEPEDAAAPAGEKPLAERLKAEMRLLNTALLTRGVTWKKVSTRDGVRELLTAVERLREGKAGREDFECAGLEFPGRDDEPNVVAALLREIIARHLEPPGQIESVQQVEDWGRAASAVVGVAYRDDHDPIGAEQLAIVLGKQDMAGLDSAANLLGQVSPNTELQKRMQSVEEIAKLVAMLAPIATGAATWDAYAVLDLQPPGDTKQAKDTLAAWNRIAKERGAKLLLDELQREAKEIADKNRPPETAATPANGVDPKKTAMQEACRKLLEILPAGKAFPWPGAGKVQTLVELKGVRPGDLQEAVEVALGGVEGWRPKAERLPPKNDAVEWGLKGLPGDEGKRWATLRMKGDEKGGGVVVEFDVSANAPRACGYVPIVLKLKGLDERPNPDQPPRCWFRFEAQELGIDSDATLIGLLDPPAGEKPERGLTIKDWPVELKAVASSCSMRIEPSGNLPKGFEVKPEPTGKPGQSERLVVFYESELDFDGETVPAVLIEELLCSLQPATGVLTMSAAGKAWKERHTRWKPDDKAGAKEEARPIGPTLVKNGLVTSLSWEAYIQLILSDRLSQDVKEIGRRIGVTSLPGSSQKDIEQAKLNLTKYVSQKAEKERAKAAKTTFFNGLKPEEKERFQKQYDAEISKLEKDLDGINRAIKKNSDALRDAEARLEIDLAAWSPWPVTPHNSKQPRPICGKVGWRQEPREYLTGKETHFTKVHHGKNNEKELARNVADVKLLYEYRRSQQPWFDEVAAGDWSDPGKAKPEVNLAQNEWIAVQALTELDGLILVRRKPTEVRQAFTMPLSSLLGRLTVSIPWQVEGIRQPVDADALQVKQ